MQAVDGAGGGEGVAPSPEEARRRVTHDSLHIIPSKELLIGIIRILTAIANRGPSYNKIEITLLFKFRSANKIALQISLKFALWVLSYNFL